MGRVRSTIESAMSVKRAGPILERRTGSHATIRPRAIDFRLHESRECQRAAPWQLRPRISRSRQNHNFDTIVEVSPEWLYIISPSRM